MSASRTAASRSSATSTSRPPTESAECGLHRALARAVPERDLLDRPHRRMRAHEMRRERARADHHQMRGILARQIGRRERGRAGGAPRGERRAVHHGERLAGLARHQHIAAVDRRAATLRVVGKHRDDLAAEERAVRRTVHAGISSTMASAPRGCVIVMMVAQRHRRRRLRNASAQRLDQRRIGQDAIEFVGGDDAHGCHAFAA